ncbi:MAG: pseudouridine synthase [Eubacteriales bacterium]|nr:pseudouridine synthase [Eubacteriales bacterium]
MRLDKYLADMNVGKRSELKKEIRKGKVTVNGAIVRDPGQNVSAQDMVVCNGAPVRYEEYVYYMLHKPAGVISASEDRRQETVVDLIEDRARNDLFPVGRLDKDTEGLLLITNDGELTHRLLSPKKHVDKVYYAKVHGEVTQEDVERFAQGLMIDETFTALPADLRILAVRPSGREEEAAGETQPESIVSEVEITIREGKFHQIKRMFAAAGKEVIYLKRLSMGPLVLDDSLARGQYRRLSETELEELRKLR